MKSYLLLLIFTSFQSILLSAQDKTYTEWYLQREDGDIFVKELGTGSDTVIVIHGGFGASHGYMIDAIKDLENKFHFVFYDQRGSLLSPIEKENLTFQKNVDDLYALIKALKLKKVKLFCHSMGTLVGMEFSEQHPNLVANLVLAGVILPKSDSIQSVFSKRQKNQVDFLLDRKEVIELVKPYKEKGVDSLKSIQDIGESQLTHKDLTEYWRIRFSAVNIYNVKKYNLLKGGRAYYKQDASVMVETVNWDYDYRDVMNGTKTTIINGGYDFLDFHSEILKSLLKGYENIDLKIIPNAGHNSWIDDPSRFKLYLKNALTR